MKYLIQGMESELRLSTLLGFTDIRSKPTIQALKDHLQANHLGLPDNLAAAKNGIELSNFSRALKRLNEIAEQYEALKAYELQHLKSVK